MSDSTAYMITDVLKDAVAINGLSGITSDQYALKTGTTNYDEDAIREYGYSSDAAPDGLGRRIHTINKFSSMDRIYRK